ncbi:MAG: Gfo/Idh/MocA family protein [Armatimonadota bacterium]
MREAPFVTSAVRPWKLTEDREPLRVVIVGAGKMARAHLEVLRDLPGVSLAGISNRSSDAGERLASEFNIERAYRDTEQMLTEARPDAAIIAVSHSVTYPITRMILQMGVPCLIEKPAGYTVEETRELAEIAGQRGVINVVALNRRYYSAVNRALLAVMQYGPVRGVVVEANDSVERFRSRRAFDNWLYQSWLVANGIHAVDLLRMIAGDAVRVASIRQSWTEPCPDSLSSIVEMESGCIGTFVAHWNSRGYHALKIFGRGVMADLRPVEYGFLRYDTGRVIRVNQDSVDTRYKPGVYGQMVAFLQAVCDGQPAGFPASDLADSVKTMTLISQIAGAGV